jgi:hypothetical protein
MKLFILNASEDMHQPRMLNWFQKVGPGYMTLERFHKLPRVTSVDVELWSESIFPDVVSYPRFMVANKFSEILQIYEPGLTFKYIAMFDKQNRRSQMYAMPAVEEVMCLSDESKLSLTKNEIIRAVIQREKAKEHALFSIADVSKQYIVADLHLIESLLRRKMTGISLQEVILAGNVII